MQTTSTDYKLEIKKPSRSFECRITIGNNIYTNDDIVDIILETIQPGEGFSIGNTPSQTLDLTLVNRGDTIYSTSQVKVEIGLKIGATIENILMGLFNIDDIEKTDYTTKFTCYDNMIRFETPYFSSLTYPASLQQVVNELATKTGVQFTGSLPAYTVKKLEGFTCREILGYVSSLCGGNALITRDGKFTIVTPKDIDHSITPDNYIDYKREEVKYKIGKVSCKVGDKELNKGSLGTDSMEVKFENPWVTDSILNDIYTKLNGFEYLGYTMKWQGDISLDVGDIVTCTDIKGAVRKIPILSQKFTYNGGLTAEIGAKGETKNKNSFNSSGSGSNKLDRVVTELLIVNEALINKANIQDLEAVSIRTQTIEAKTAAIEVAIIDVAHVSDLTAINANIEKLIAADATMGQAIIGKANITDLTASVGRIEILESSVGDIQTLVNGNLTSNNIQSLILSSDKVTVVNGFIKNAMIENLDVSKINAGDISVNKFRIKSDSGNLLIFDNTIQIKDATRTRVQIGKDASNDYNMYVWDSTGKLMFDATGLKADGIKQKIIRDDMVSDNANISGDKLNISSVVTSINNGAATLNSSKVHIDGTAQTLDVAFNTLTTKVESDAPTITTDNSIIKLDGAIDGMLKINSIGGKTLQNLLGVSNKVITTTDAIISNTILMKSNTKYTIKCNVKNSLYTATTYGTVVVIFYPTLGTQALSIGGSSSISLTNGFKEMTVTTREEIPTMIKILLHSDNATSDSATIEDVVVLEGDWTNKEIPYFEGIRSVGENENLEVISCGKNLFNGQLKQGSYKSSDGTYQNVPTYVCNFDSIKVKQNTTYVLSTNVTLYGAIILCYTQTGKFIKYIFSELIGGKFTTPTGCDYINFDLYNSANITPSDVEWVQLEEGTTPTACEPYQGHKQPLALTNPLRGLPNGVKDTVNFKKGVVVRNVGKVVFDGIDEGWSPYVRGTNETYASYYININDGLKACSMICDKLQVQNPIQLGVQECISSGSATNLGIFISILKTKIATPDVAGFKAWLQANPVTVYYQLATPIEEPIDVEQYMKQFKDGYFLNEGSLINPIVDLTYSTSLASATSMMKEVTESNTTALNIQQGKISALISNTTIVKDGVTTQLKDAYNSTVATVDSISNVISSHTSTIDNLTGQVLAVDTKTNSVRRDLDGTIEIVSQTTTTANSALSKASEAQKTADGFLQRVSNIETNYATTQAMNSAISQKADSIKLEVSNSYLSKNDALNTYATKSSLTQTEDSIVAKFTSTGGYNLLRNSAFANKDTVNWSLGGGWQRYPSLTNMYYTEYGCIALYPVSSGNTRGLLGQTLSENLKKNTKYTFSLTTFWEYNITEVNLYMDYKNGSTYVANTIHKFGSSYNRQSYTFTTPNATFDTVAVYIELKSNVASGNWVARVIKPCLCEGDVAVWSPHPSELIDGSTQIDANGVTIYNGAIDIRNKVGTSVLKGDANGNLMVRGNLYADPANPILHLFGGCSLDATYANEQGVGNAIRLKWDEANYLYVSTNNVSIYQSGVSRYTFSPTAFTVNTSVVIDGGFLIIGGKKNRGWGFSSGNKYYLGISGDDTYVRMYNDDVTVANGVSYLGSPSGRYIKVYSTQAADVSSDRRKKTNILAYDEKIESFYDKLKPISYELINGHSGRKHYGFIAQEVESAMNEVGLDYKDMALLQKAPMDAEGNEIDPTTIVDYETDERIADYEYSLAYTEMISINTHMIQKLRAEITKLKNEISEIKGLG